MDCASLQSSTQSSNMAMRWVRRLERCACGCLTYFPLAFVYSLTTWATWVVCSIGSHSKHTPWIGRPARQEDPQGLETLLTGHVVM